MASLASENQSNTVRLGVYRQPGIRKAYPELHRLLMKIYTDRVSKLPFVPSYWVGGVMALADSAPDDLIKLSPVATANGTPIMGEVPAFVGNDVGKRKAWQAVVDVMTAAIQNFIAGKIEDGKAEMEAANANAEFWDTLYTIAVNTRDAVPNAIGWTFSNFWNGLGDKWKIILAGAAVVGAVYVVVKLGGAKNVAAKVAKAVSG